MERANNTLGQTVGAYIAKSQKEIDTLLDLQNRLEAGSQQVHVTRQAFVKETADLKQASKLMDAKAAELEAWLKEAESKEDIDPDKTVIFKDPWSKQLFECVAEDHAIEDTMYCLETLLSDEKCELKAFLKEIRKLARKQFMARALAKKVISKQRSVGMGHSLSRGPNILFQPAPLAQPAPAITQPTPVLFQPAPVRLV